MRMVKVDFARLRGEVGRGEKAHRVAKAVGITRHTLTRKLNYRAPISICELNLIGKSLGIDVDRFLEFYEEE